MENKYCKWCNFLHIDHCVFEGCANFSCVLTPNRKQFLDSAEFEARVAEWLAHDEIDDNYKRHPCTFKCRFAYDDIEACPHKWEWCRLKMARLAIEEEMDG